MSLLQGSLSQLIYRYLAGGGQGEDHQEALEDTDQRRRLLEDADQRRRVLEEADRKTRLLLSLVQDIHRSAHIMKYRTRSRHHVTNA